MNSIRRITHLISCIVAAASLCGCAHIPYFGDARPAGAHARAETAAPSPDQAALKDGISEYNNGQYNDAIKHLGSNEITHGSKATQLTALKYTAFSYCVTSRQTLCQKTFEKAFKIDPNFDLAPGEHGHPLWGPAFTRAKKHS